MKWAFRRGKGITSKVIGYFGSGYYSHVDVVTPSGMFRGSRSDCIETELGIIPPGYWDRPPDYEIPEVLDIYELTVTEVQERLYWDFSAAQLGKPYDSRGIWGIALGQRNWRDPDKWFCSEEVAANCEYATIFRPLWKGYNSIDPGEVALLLSVLGATRKRQIG